MGFLHSTDETPPWEITKSDASRSVRKDISQHCMGICQGQQRFYHPGAPETAGRPYELNKKELRFGELKREELWAAASKGGLVGMAGPVALWYSPLGPALKKFTWTTPYVPSLICCVVGIWYGGSRLRDKLEWEEFRLRGSPLAAERRWWFRQKFPSHPWLNGFETEPEEQELRAGTQANAHHQPTPLRSVDTPELGVFSEFFDSSQQPNDKTNWKDSIL